MTTPLISIIIPVYNGSKTLSKCLDSVSKQDYSSYEILVVDNNSTDATKSIIESFMKKYNFVKYVFEEKRSRGAARNQGIKHALGEIIVMTDCDCVVATNWINDLTNNIREGKENFVMGWEEDLIQSSLSQEIHRWNERYFQENIYDGSYINVLDTKNFAARSNLLKQFFFDENLGNCEDTDLALRLQSKYRIFFNPNIKVGHFHKTTWAGWIRVNVDRAKWMKKIYLKYKEQGNIISHNVFKGFKIKSLPEESFWWFVKYLRCPTAEKWFEFVSHTTWLIGLRFF